MVNRDEQAVALLLQNPSVAFTWNKLIKSLDCPDCSGDNSVDSKITNETTSSHDIHGSLDANLGNSTETSGDEIGSIDSQTDSVTLSSLLYPLHRIDPQTLSGDINHTVIKHVMESAENYWGISSSISCSCPLSPIQKSLLRTQEGPFDVISEESCQSNQTKVEGDNTETITSRGKGNDHLSFG